MNQKLLHLIAAQFGIIIGLLSWMVYSHFEVPELPATEEGRNIAMAPIEAAIPVSNLDYPRPYVRPYQSEQLAQPIEQQPAADQYYDQQVAAQPYANQDANSAYYTQAAQEPVTSEPGYGYDYVPAEPVIYAPIQNFQNVVLFNGGHRSRQQHCNPDRMNPNRCPPRPRHQVNPLPLPPISPPAPNLDPRGSRPPRNVMPAPPNTKPPAPVVLTGVKRSGSPVSSKTGRINTFVP